MDPYRGPDADARLGVLADVATEVGAMPNQCVLAWLLHRASHSVIPLIGPRTLEQFDAALPAVDIKLTGGKLARLDSAGAADLCGSSLRPSAAVDLRPGDVGTSSAGRRGTPLAAG